MHQIIVPHNQEPPHFVMKLGETERNLPQDYASCDNEEQY